MQVEQEVLAVLSAAQIEGNQLRIVEQLERKLYVRTNKVLEAAGGKWNSKAKAHLFTEDPADVLDRVILTGRIDLPKQDFGFFPSPPPVVHMVIDRAGLFPGYRVLEPSAGDGALAKAIRMMGCDTDCIELQARNVEKLRAMNFPTIEGDFLESVPQPVYDRVVMNPPFAGGADVRHVRHALGFLKLTGSGERPRLVSVMGAGVTFRQDRLYREFREFVTAQGGRIEPLPDGSFKESGTMVRTVLVTIPW